MKRKSALINLMENLPRKSGANLPNERKVKRTLEGLRVDYSLDDIKADVAAFQARNKHPKNAALALLLAIAYRRDLRTKENSNYLISLIGKLPHQHQRINFYQKIERLSAIEGQYVLHSESLQGSNGLMAWVAVEKSKNTDAHQQPVLDALYERVLVWFSNQQQMQNSNYTPASKSGASCSFWAEGAVAPPSRTPSPPSLASPESRVEAGLELAAYHQDSLLKQCRVLLSPKTPQINEVVLREVFVPRIAALGDLNEAQMGTLLTAIEKCPKDYNRLTMVSLLSRAGVESPRLEAMKPDENNARWKAVDSLVGLEVSEQASPAPRV